MFATDLDLVARKAVWLMCAAAALVSATVTLMTTVAHSQVLSLMPVRNPATTLPAVQLDGGGVITEIDRGGDGPAHLRRQVVDYPSSEATGTIIIDTPRTYLYYVLGHGKAIRYGVGVGRTGFTWSGVKQVAEKSEWPDWHPPAEMIKRQPYLPRMVAGGLGNPLGRARDLYRRHPISHPRDERSNHHR